MDEYIPTNWQANTSIIKVIGVGGGGGNAVTHMFQSDIKDVDFVICNTDAQALENSPVPNKVRLGTVLTRGRGAGCDPQVARQAALESQEHIKALFEGKTEMVFITAGMGGGTGTGATPVIASIAREMDLLTVGVVTLPFRDEGPDFLKRALQGIQELQEHVDTLLIIDNEKLYNVFGDLSIFEAFKRTDDILTTAVKGISEIITRPGVMNVDFADVKMVMKKSGMALMGTGSAKGENRAIKAVEAAFTSPLLNDADLKRARNVLINITSGKEKALSMSELSQIMSCISEYTGGAANFKRGVICDESLQDEICITVIATGFSIHSLPPLNVHNASQKPMAKERIPLIEETPNNRPQTYIAPQTGLPDDDTEGISVSDRRSTFLVEGNDMMAGYQQGAQPLYGTKPALILERGDNIAELENVPAYIRRKKASVQEPASPQISEPSTSRISEQNGQQVLGTDNAYIHQTQD